MSTCYQRFSLLFSFDLYYSLLRFPRQFVVSAFLFLLLYFSIWKCLPEVPFPNFFLRAFNIKRTGAKQTEHITFFFSPILHFLLVLSYHYFFFPFNDLDDLTPITSLYPSSLTHLPLRIPFFPITSPLNFSLIPTSTSACYFILARF